MKRLSILIACERSGVIREAFRALGHDAWSCDLMPADDGSPYHIQGCALNAIHDRHWHLIGMHPECTFLTVAGMHWNDRGRGWDKTAAALQFVRDCFAAAGDTPHYLENPVSIISTQIRRPEQIVQPYDFGDDASKKTCLWLHKLSPLPVRPQDRCPGRIVTRPDGRTVERWANQTDSGQNRLGPSETRAKERSRSYPGIAARMAEHWGRELLATLTP